MRKTCGILLTTCLAGVLALGCGESEVKRLDQRFRGAMEAGNPSEAYAVLGQLQARGFAAESRLTAFEKAECYVGYSEEVLDENYDRALQTAELARQSIQQVEQSGEPVPPTLDQRFIDLYETLVRRAPEHLTRPELQRVKISEDLPEQLVADRTRPLDTQILELLIAQGLAELEEQNRELAERNRQLEDQSREIRDRVENLREPVSDMDERIDRVSNRLGELDETEKDMDRLEENVSRISEDTRTLRTDLEGAVKDLEMLRTAQGATSEDVERVRERLVALVNRAGAIETQVQEVDTRLERFEEGIVFDNLFRDGLAAFSRGDRELARGKLSAFLEKAPGDASNVPEAAAVLGVIAMDRVREILSMEEWKISREDMEEAQTALGRARDMLARAQEKLDAIQSAQLQNSVRRELARIDDYSRELMRR